MCLPMGLPTVGLVDPGRLHCAAELAAMPSLGSAGPVTVWVVVLTFVFIECAFFIGMFLPGDSLLLTAGVLLAQSNDQAGAWALSVGTAVAAVAGNQTGFLLGRYPA